MRTVTMSMLVLFGHIALAQPTTATKTAKAATTRSTTAIGDNTTKQTAPTQPAPAQLEDSTNVQLNRIREDLHALRAEKESWSSPKILLPIVGTLLGATGGGIFALLQLNRTNKHQRLLADDAAKNARTLAADAAEHERLLADDSVKRAAEEKHRDRLFEGLKWFEGNSQPRSIGIALIEANWFTWPDLQPTWTTVIANQAIHLLTATKRTDSRVEFTNLARIMELLQWPATGSGRAFDAYLSDEQKGQVLGAIRDATASANDASATGLAVEPGTLSHWKFALAKQPAPQ